MKVLKYLPVFCLIWMGGIPAGWSAVEIGPAKISAHNTVMVLDPGVDLQDIIDNISGEAADNPFIIQLGAGQYSLDSSLEMDPHISIVGSGQGVTILSGAVSSGMFSQSAVIECADNTLLSNLTIENTGAGAYQTGIRNIGTDCRMENLEISINSDNGTRNTGIFVDVSTAELILQNVDITLSGSTTENYGIEVRNSALVTINNVRIEVSEGSTNYGIKFAESAATTVVKNAKITASLGGGNSALYFTASAYATLFNVAATSFGGSGNNFGLEIFGSTSTAIVDSSRLTGATNGISFGSSTGSKVSNTLVSPGHTGDSAAQTNCHNILNAGFGAVAAC